jgi:signal transduction histidine kinase
MTAVWRMPRLTGPRAVDVALALAVALGLSAVISADRNNPGPELSVGQLAYLWAVGLSALMLIRRQRPLLVLVLTTLGFFSYYMAGFPAIGVAVPFAAALYSAAEQRHVWAAVITSVGVLTISTGFRLLSGQDPAYVLGYELVSHAGFMASVIALGYSICAWRDLRRSKEKVAALTTLQAAAQAELEARRARLSLARELHDSIGHSLAVASLFTNVARESGSDLERGSALEKVRAAVSESMNNLRSTVVLLRAPEPVGEHLPTLADLDRVLEAPASAGFAVEASIDKDLHLPVDVEAAAFRLVQEAVTNTIKHSNGSRLEVAIQQVGADQVQIEVRDDGRSGTAADVDDGLHHGQGLAGMRERVRALGGTLTISADADGWAVQSSIPTGAAGVGA